MSELSSNNKICRFNDDDHFNGIEMQKNKKKNLKL